MTHPTVVQRGAALLDELRPGWYLQIDLEMLNVCMYNRCILGQLFGNYHIGLRVLITSRKITSFFDLYDFGFEATGIAAFDDLTEDWYDLIQDRLALEEK